MIVVTGPTGNIGSRLLPRLAERGAAVRAVAHSPERRAAIEELGIEAVEADFDRPDSMVRAMEGCDQLFLLSPTHPDIPRRETAAIDAARRAGVSSIVKLSSMGAAAESPCDLLRRHGEAEAHLMASGLEYTILRAACFMPVHLLPVQTVTATGTWYGMTGDGAHAYIDLDDIAAAAAAVLTTGGHAGAVYELTGPRAITMPEAAGELSEVLGTPVTYVDLPADDFRTALVGAGLPEWLVDGIVALYRIVRDGHLATVSRTVEELTGRPPGTYAEFAARHAGAFAAT